MIKNVFLVLTLSFTVFISNGQIDESYLKANAIRLDNPEKLSDTVYNLLSPFQVIMFGEMHGTNESAPFVSGLTSLFTSKGDNVLVGLEIPPSLMTKFNSLYTESSIYESDFFSNPPFLDGKESLPWANLIASLNKNRKVKLFFFDVDPNETQKYDRDSIMAAKIKTQFEQNPSWRMITFSGNYHNRISNPSSMTSVFKRNTTAKVCSLNMEYKEGNCMANFSGEGFKKKALGSRPSAINSTDGYECYILLLPANTAYEYNGFYYTKTISAATMTVHQ